ETRYRWEGRFRQDLDLGHDGARAGPRRPRRAGDRRRPESQPRAHAGHRARAHGRASDPRARARRPQARRSDAHPAAGRARGEPRRDRAGRRAAAGDGQPQACERRLPVFAACRGAQRDRGRGDRGGRRLHPRHRGLARALLTRHRQARRRRAARRRALLQVAGDRTAHGRAGSRPGTARRAGRQQGPRRRRARGRARLRRAPRHSAGGGHPLRRVDARRGARGCRAAGPRRRRPGGEGDHRAGRAGGRAWM
ncbi:MAG: hypothetical protein AVDCRST_MAG69-79, partial [uncultured Solirubrobacteraceae bacterium]